MLQILRKKASSWIVKIMLGTVAIVFIFFFGSSSLRNQSDAANPVAVEVEGVPITERMVLGALQMGKDFNPSLNELPQELEPQIRNQVLRSLIEKEVVTRQARQLGFRVTNEEIAEAIRKDPRIPRIDSQIDVNRYQEQFRPWHANRYGIDYEEWVKENLLAEKLRNQFANLAPTGPLIKDKPDSPSLSDWAYNRWVQNLIRKTKIKTP